MITAQYRTISNLKQIHFYKMLNNYPKDYYTEWEKYFVNTLNKHAPFKTKEVRGNHKNIMIIME